MQLSQLLTGLFSSAFLLYICYSLWTLSQLFTVTPCLKSTNDCLLPLLKDDDQLQVRYQHLSAAEFNCFSVIIMMMITVLSMFIIIIITVSVVLLYNNENKVIH